MEVLLYNEDALKRYGVCGEVQDSLRAKLKPRLICNLLFLRAD